ncbi:MAG: TlyA family RNA methyltransferase [Sedimentibacter sp.]|uniref:TlyA family RNA methyltransferase n=1 Tax=Sedimentibacter sp. TaxID=1960295 RepID=UPI0031580E57
MEEYRLDVYLHIKGYASSRERAKQLISGNCVHLNDKLVTKSSTKVTDNDVIRVDNIFPYVGRGAVKLEKALNHFSIDAHNAVAVDVGASTGGFTDFLLKHGARKVYAVDVGHGQLHESLRNENRVINLENTNFRYIDSSLFTESVDIVTVDVSFISLKLIFPKIVEISHDKTKIVALVKPQFEAGRDNIGKNGIVKDRKVHLAVLRNIESYLEENGLYLENITYSPVKGGDGNIEYLACAGRNKNYKAFNFKDLINEAFEIL